jgi:pimeloyl-ACP methyl ester carboxylesterase
MAAGAGIVTRSVIPQRLAPPPLLYTCLEWSRSAWELGSLYASLPLLRNAPRGDGHPVLVLPGFGGDDASTFHLRAFLADRGYTPHRWLQGRNWAQARLLPRLRRRLQQLGERHGRRVSLIGWSMGGLYARELAQRDPQAVRSVITLGAPFTGDPEAIRIGWLYEWITGRAIADNRRYRALRRPLPQPTTSIYTRSDGIVAWRRCVEGCGECCENIEVPGSHVGLGHNPLVLFAIADRLAQPAGAWKPFDRSGLRSLLYPDPTRP